MYVRTYVCIVFAWFGLGFDLKNFEVPKTFLWRVLSSPAFFPMSLLPLDQLAEPWCSGCRGRCLSSRVPTHHPYVPGRFQLGLCPHFLIHPKPPRIDPCVLGNRRVSPQVHKEQPAKNRWNPLRKWLKHPAPFSITAPLHVSNFCA